MKYSHWRYECPNGHKSFARRSNFINCQNCRSDDDIEQYKFKEVYDCKRDKWIVLDNERDKRSPHKEKIPRTIEI